MGNISHRFAFQINIKTGLQLLVFDLSKNKSGFLNFNSIQGTADIQGI